MEEDNPRDNFSQWQDKTIKERPDWLWERFIELLEERAEAVGIEYCALESLYSPALTRALQTAFGRDLVVVYVDIPTEVRLQRQIIRRDLKTIDEAREHLLPRDKDKMGWGALQIKEMADIVINNSGTIEELYEQVDKMLTQYCPELV